MKKFSYCAREGLPLPCYNSSGESNQDKEIHSRLAVPAEIYLSAEGVSLLSAAGLNIKNFYDSHGIKREGISAAGLSGNTLRKLIMKSMVDEIRISLPELLTRRNEILNLNSLILYTVLYRKLNPVLSARLFNSAAVKDFNRKNPKISIVSLDHISRVKVSSLKSFLSQEFSSMQSDLKNCITGKLISDPDTGPDKRKTQLRSISRIFEFIDERIWYLYFVISRTSTGEKFRNVFADEIIRFLSHSVLADHFGSLLMEFIQNAEKAHFERIMRTFSLCSAADQDEFLRSSSNRKRIASIAESRGEMLEVSWVIRKERTAVSSQSRMAVMICNPVLISESRKDMIRKKMQSSAEGMILADFYKMNEELRLGAGLGLYYNAFIEDFCRRNGIYYRSSVFQEAAGTCVQAEIIL